MKLQLRNSGSTDTAFDLPRNLGLALLAIGRGEIVEPSLAASPQRPSRAVWSIGESLTFGGPVLHCKCESQACRSTLNAWGPTAAQTQKFRHTCGAGAEAAPPEIQEAYALAYKRSVEDPQPKRRAPGIPVL